MAKRPLLGHLPKLSASIGLLALWGCGGGSDEAPRHQGASAQSADSTPADTANMANPAGSTVAGPAVGVQQAEAEAPGPGSLPDEAAQRGVRYRNLCGEPEKATILEAGGAGVALLDLGGDGDLDLVFAQGLGSLASLREGPGADLELFVNDGSGVFEEAAGPGLAGWWTGLATGDVDGDGLCDLVAGGFGSLRVLLQQPDGSLVPGPELLAGSDSLAVGAPREAGLPPCWITSLALCDLDRDGRLDLYVGGYLELDPVAPPEGRLGEGALSIPCRWKGHSVYCGPAGMTPLPDRVLRGAGDGTFADVSERWLPGHVPGYTLAVLPFDADLDGDLDVAVANDSSANLLLVNEGDGRLVDRGFEAGVALGMEGQAEAGMGLAAGDVNRDGRPDLALTNFSDEPTSLYLGAPVGFTNATFRLALSAATRHLLSWSIHLEDMDADGWLDLYVANGHVYPQADEPGTGTSYGQADSLFRLLPGEKARPFELESSALLEPVGTRGSAIGDLDGDGAPDLVLSRIDAPAALVMNRLPQGRRLVIRCLGPREPLPDASRRTPPDGNGTKVLVVTRAADGEERGFLEEVRTAEGYQSASSPWLHLGLGAAERAQVRILWPSGETLDLGELETDQRLIVREGEGIVAREPLP